jgi:hypothetical protein
MCYNCTLAQMDNCTDSLGTSFKTYTLYSYHTTTTNALGFIQITAGIAPSTGADTVSCGASLLLSIGEFSNINYLAMDNIVGTRWVTASPAT